MALSYHQQEEMHEKVTKGKYEIMWAPQKENVQKENFVLSINHSRTIPLSLLFGHSPNGFLRQDTLLVFLRMWSTSQFQL